MEEIPGCKFLFSATFGCRNKECNAYAAHGNAYYGCICNHCASISFSVLNLGPNVQAGFDIGIENPYKSITSVSKVTKKLLNNEKICASFQFKQVPEGTNNKRGDYFSTQGNITFIFTVTTDDAAEVTVPAPPQYPGVHAKLAEQFSEEYINVDSPPDSLVDFVLHVGANKIHCHKLILSMTSTYFRRMFESNMKEARNNYVHLKDIDFTTLKSLVKFMYCDEIDDSKITLNLIKAADRFEVMRLREICCKKLREKDINLKNVAMLWETAYVHSIGELIHDCVAFMTINWKSLVKDEKIIQLADTYRELPITISLCLSEMNTGCK